MIGEVAEFVATSQIRKGHSPYMCAAVSAAMLEAMQPLGTKPTLTSDEVFLRGEYWYKTIKPTLRRAGMTEVEQYTMLDAMGLTYVKHCQYARAALRAGHPLLVRVHYRKQKPNHAHLLLFTGITKDGKTIVRNVAGSGRAWPMREKRTYVIWDITEIIPFWLVNQQEVAS